MVRKMGRDLQTCREGVGGKEKVIVRGSARVRELQGKKDTMWYALSNLEIGY